MRLKGINEGFFVLLLLISSIAFILVLKAYFSAIFWAAILAVLFYPLKTTLRQKLSDRNGLSSFITVIVICLIVFIPLSLVTTSLAIESNELYNSIQQNQIPFPTLINNIVGHLPGNIQDIVAEHRLSDPVKLQQRIADLFMQGSQTLASSALLIGESTFSFTIGFVVMLYLLFFLLKDGSYLIKLILDAIPLSKHAKHHLFVKFAAVTKATVKGTAVVAIVQGALGGMAFYFVGVEGSILWGALMAFLSLIPAIGSAIIWAPVALYFIIAGPVWKGIALVVFFVVVVGVVDNILRPILVGKDTKMPDYLVLISTLGGMELFGINGFVIGPLIAALFIASWNLLSGRDHKGNIEEIDKDIITEARENEIMLAQQEAAEKEVLQQEIREKKEQKEQEQKERKEQQEQSDQPSRNA